MLRSGAESRLFSALLPICDRDAGSFAYRISSSRRSKETADQPTAAIASSLSGDYAAGGAGSFAYRIYSARRGT